LAKESAVYEIVIQGHLAPHRLQQFESLAVTHQPSGETRLVGSMPDQAALYGLLNWLRDLGAPLISVRRLDSGEGTRDDRRQASDTSTRLAAP
jgi:hypothetical protein